MPFDPISWAAGFILTRAAQKGLELAYPKTLRRQLEREIEDWAKTVSKSAYIYPETLFMILSNSDEDLTARPSLKRFREQLLNLTIPSEGEWLDCLMEQWSLIGRKHATEAQEFFQLDELEARTYLARLAHMLYQRCCEDEKSVLPHVVQSLDRIEVTLDELRRFNALKAIPRDFKPDLELAQRVTDAARKAAMLRGWSMCREMHIEERDRVVIVLVFGEGDFETVCGLMEIDEEQILSWSSLDEDVLLTAIGGSMFGIPLFSGIEESWNNMVEFVGRIARRLYPNTVHDGVYGISAQFDLKRIGVPFPVGFKVNEADDRVSMLKLGGEELVPFLTFGSQQLQSLVHLGEADASGRIAAWLLTEWGIPTLIAR